MDFISKKNSSVPDDPKESLKYLLGLLHAMYWTYNTCHWQAKGQDSYEKHLLFQRLYEGMREEIDDLAEKLVGYFGVEMVNQEDIISISKKFVDEWSKEKDLTSRCVNMEKLFQNIVHNVYYVLKNSKNMSMGLDDYLMSICNAHETNLYLLSQLN